MEPQAELPARPESLPPYQPTPPPDFTKKKALKKKVALLLLIIMVLVGITGAAYYALTSKQSNTANSSQPNATEQSEQEIDAHPNRLRLIATGDMIAHDAINAAAKQTDGSYSYYPMMQNMKEFFDASDVRFCNQAVLGAGSAFGIKGYPVFNSPLEFARDMQKIGCNVVNTGTNHTNDISQAAINASVAAWDTLPNMLAVAGANRTAEEQQKVRYFESKGVKFAFVSYTSYTNKPGATAYGLNSFDEALMQSQLTEARSKADIVIVSSRWGTEYSPGINAAQDDWAVKLVNMGADVILGHGPHVLEPVKRIKATDGREAIVWFSLGNFFNAQLEAEALFNGIAVMDIDTTTKKITEVSYMPIYMHYEWTAAEKAAEDLLARKNFAMYALDKAGEQITKSLIGTTAEAQLARITSLLNTHTEIKIVNSTQYLD